MDERGKPGRVPETASDLTARECADQEVRSRAARYRYLFETTGLAILECDVSLATRRIAGLLASDRKNFREHVKENPGIVRELVELTVAQDANEACVRLFGASSKANLLTCFHQIWLASAGISGRSIVDALEGRTTLEYEASVLDLRGVRLDLAVTIALPSAAAPFTVFIAVADITSKTRVQAALRDAQVALAHATRVSSLGELAASIAHEVKQPLTGIISHGQAGLRWLVRDRPDLAAVRHSLERIVEEGKRATSVVEGVRAIARNDPLQLSLVNIHELSLECIGLLATEIEEADIVLAAPLAVGKGFVRADRIQIQQVMINLLLNAIEALSGLQGRQRVLTVTTWSNEEVANFLVKDSGPGISSDVRDNLFKAFVTSKSGGMGLGLSVCRSIIERSGGKIWAEKTGDVGAAFRFSLPLAPEGENE